MRTYKTKIYDERIEISNEEMMQLISKRKQIMIELGLVAMTVKEKWAYKRIQKIMNELHEELGLSKEDGQEIMDMIDNIISDALTKKPTPNQTKTQKEMK